MYYVYVIREIKGGKLYFGYTRDLRRRLSQHHRKTLHELIYYEAYKAESDARRRERKLKDYGQAITALKSRLRESLK